MGYIVKVFSFSAFNFFFNTVPSSSSVKCLFLISSRLLIICFTGFSVTLRRFSRRCLKWFLPTFVWQFLLLLSSCSSFRSLHLLSPMLFVIPYLLPSFWFYWFTIDCTLVFVCDSSLSLVSVGILYKVNIPFSGLTRFSRIAIECHRTLHLALGFGGNELGGCFYMGGNYFFIFVSEVCASKVSGIVSNLFLTVIVYWFPVSLLESDDLSYRRALTVWILFLRRLRRIFA